MKKESGQSAVLIVLSLSLLLGIAAIVVDGGAMYLTKRRLQNAADSAALAGAMKLPSQTEARSTAIQYAVLNGADESGVVISTPYNGDPSLIEVVCTRDVGFGFAGILGFSEENISARSVARHKQTPWAGEAFPFINLDDDYESDPHIVIWEKTGPGDFESLWKNEYSMYNLGKYDDHSKGYFEIYYQDGLTVTKGVVATIKQEIGYLYEQQKPGYVFSLSAEAIRSGRYDNCGNKDRIPLDDIVLLQVTFDNYYEKGKTLELTVTGVYDINNGELPTEYLIADADPWSNLVE